MHYDLARMLRILTIFPKVEEMDFTPLADFDFSDHFDFHRKLALGLAE